MRRVSHELGSKCIVGEVHLIDMVVFHEFLMGPFKVGVREQFIQFLLSYYFILLLTLVFVVVFIEEVHSIVVN